MQIADVQKFCFGSLNLADEHWATCLAELLKGNSPTLPQKMLERLTRSTKPGVPSMENNQVNIERNPTRSVKIGSIEIGAGNRIAVQSMTATKTTDIDATVELVNLMYDAGADVVRIAVDNKKEAAALAEIRKQTKANLSVDLQENYRMAEIVAPHVDKLRYNPGHLYHHETAKPWQLKVDYLAGIAKDNDCAMRVGVNCGSVDPAKKEKYSDDDSITPMLESALEHCEYLDSIGFQRFCVSLKDSDPSKVIEVNQRFAERRPDVPLHLGVTEAGIPPAVSYTHLTLPTIYSV